MAHLNGVIRTKKYAMKLERLSTALQATRNIISKILLNTKHKGGPLNREHSSYSVIALLQGNNEANSNQTKHEDSLHTIQGHRIKGWNRSIKRMFQKAAKRWSEEPVKF